MYVPHIDSPQRGDGDGPKEKADSLRNDEELWETYHMVSFWPLWCMPKTEDVEESSQGHYCK